MATPADWRKNKQRVWAWYKWRRCAVLDAKQHAGHIAIAQLAETLQKLPCQAVQVTAVPQNVDNLHEQAGSSNVTHLHGSLFALGHYKHEHSLK